MTFSNIFQVEQVRADQIKEGDRIWCCESGFESGFRCVDSIEVEGDLFCFYDAKGCFYELFIEDFGVRQVAPVSPEITEEMIERGEITRDDGFTDEEGVVAEHICEAVNAFAKLPKQHPDEGRDFCDAVHRLQDLMAMRIVRRCYPKGWPNYGE